MWYSTQRGKDWKSYLVVIFCMLFWMGNSCLSLHGEVREIIDAREILNQKDNIAQCLRNSLEKGNVAFARSIIDLYYAQHQSLIAGIFERQLHRLKILQEEIILEESNCTSVVKWGQNETHIFLSMKLSHRWDSPPCLHSKQQISSLANNTFEYINICVVSHTRITFSTNFTFYDDIQTEVPDVQKDGVGIYSIILEKKERKVWPFLTLQGVSYPIWHQISERHNAVHKEYEALLDGILRAKRSKPVVFEERQQGQLNKIEDKPKDIQQNSQNVESQQVNDNKQVTDSEINIESSNQSQ